MKKLLLSVATLGAATGMFAQTADLSQLIDVTPSAYHFYQNEDLDLADLFLTDVTSPAAPNMGDFGFIVNNSDIFSKDQLGYGAVVFGGGYQNKQAELFKGFSCYNFGGEVGNVLILNGHESNLAEAIKEKLGLEAAPEIAQMAENYSGNLNYFWLEDYYTMREKLKLSVADEEGNIVETGDKVLLHIEFSAYNNDMSLTNNVMETLYEMTDQGGYVTLNVNATFNAFAVDGEWSPENWMVVEALVPYYEAPAYIRQFVTVNAALNTGALLIRDYGIYGVPADVNLGMENNQVSKNFVTYSLEGDTSGISSIQINDSEVEYYNLQGVKVANPDKGIYIIRKGNTTTKAVLR